MNTSIQYALEWVPEYGSIIVGIVLFLQLSVKTALYIGKFLRRRDRSKVKQITEALKIDNISKEMRVYLQAQLEQELFYRISGIFSSKNVTKKIIKIHDSRSKIYNFDFKSASRYADYNGTKIKINIRLTDKIYYYYILCLLLFFVLLFSVLILLGLNSLGNDNFEYKGYLWLLGLIALLIILIIAVVKDILDYKSAIKIQQYLQHKKQRQ
ncbi:MAG: hypothetical protein FE834_00015 [Gammaproteobacteria bacterium]|nr:hypothetical protein [Gammaproteobacteria bacterium]